MQRSRTDIETINAWLGLGISGLIGFLSALIVNQTAGLLAAVLFFLVAPWVGVFIHELGHEFAAKRFGMLVTEFKVGPFIRRKGRWSFGDLDDAIGSDVGGHVIYVEPEGRYLTAASDSAITVAGPIANLVAMLVAMVVGYAMLPPGALSGLFIGFAFQSLALAVASLWPLRMSSGSLSDGAKLISIAKSRVAIHSLRPKRRSGKGWNDR